MISMNKIIIYTDGASRGNPGPGGWGSIIISPGKVVELGGREAMTTNNRMELTSVIETLLTLDSFADSSAPIIVCSDSQYVIKGITEWIHGWVARGWRNSQKKTVLNRNLWEKLLEVSQNKEISWKFVKGHTDTAGNVRCDEIATRFADGENMKLYKGSMERYPFREILKKL